MGGFRPEVPAALGCQLQCRLQGEGPLPHCPDLHGGSFLGDSVLRMLSGFLLDTPGGFSPAVGTQDSPTSRTQRRSGSQDLGHGLRDAASVSGSGSQPLAPSMSCATARGLESLALFLVFSVWSHGFFFMHLPSLRVLGLPRSSLTLDVMLPVLTPTLHQEVSNF